MLPAVPSLTVLVGYKCNFSCAHCITAGKKGALSSADNKKILAAVSKYRIRRLHFVGGETTFYVREINDILSRVPELRRTSVRMTTNGHFAETVGGAAGMLGSFLKLDHVELSYDKFHSKFLPKRHIRNLYLACKKLNKTLGVLFAAESPMDLVLLEDLKEFTSLPVVVQYVVPFGAAKNNACEWTHRTAASELLEKYCPTKNKLIYLCGQGFTVCCSALTLSTSSRRFFHPTPAAHFGSGFYKLVSSCSMGQIKERFGIAGEIPEEKRISVCTLCEYLFKNRYKLD